MSAMPPGDEGTPELSIEVIDEEGRTVDTIYVTEITGRATSPRGERRTGNPHHQRNGG